jgi:DNA-binding MarR family transcriptional regulator
VGERAATAGAVTSATVARQGPSGRERGRSVDGLPAGALPFDPVAEARRHWEAHGWEDAAPGMAVVTSIMRAQQIIQVRVDEMLAPFGLTFARFELLRLLAFSRAGALPLGKAGARLQVHQTSITNAVDRLEVQGFVRRVPHPTDGRAVLAEITAEGRKIVGRATRKLNAGVFTDLGLDHDELDGLFRLLETFRRAAGDFD